MSHPIYSDLYIAKSIEELNKISKLPSKKDKDARALYILYRRSQEFPLDQEHTYLLLYRFIEIYDILIKEESYIHLQFGQDYKKAKIALNELKKSLISRYKAKFGKNINETPHDEPIVMPVSVRRFTEPMIKCRDLYKVLESGGPILLVDTRPAVEYRQSRIDAQYIINIPDELIAPGISAHVVGKRLEPDTRGVWENRHNFDVIVLYDWKSNKKIFNFTKLHKLYVALNEWDINVVYKEPAVVLEGGFLQMLEEYPTKCTNTAVLLQYKDSDLDELLNLDSYVYLGKNFKAKRKSPNFELDKPEVRVEKKKRLTPEKDEPILPPVVDRTTKPKPLKILLPFVKYDLTTSLVGLKNLRNTCYMNTTIQCLRCIPQIVDLCQNSNYRHHGLRTPAVLIEEFASLVNALWEKRSGYISPNAFYKKVCKLVPKFGKGHHEDCMEFFVFLLDKLAEDCYVNANQQSILPTAKTLNWHQNFEGKDSIFHHLFFHQICVKQTCPKCNKQSYRFEMENTFMLPCTPKDIDVKELLYSYIDECVNVDTKCNDCNSSTNNDVQLCYAPKILVILLKRYLETLMKTSSKIDFPITDLQLGNRIYDLYSIAFHTGTIDVGHYTAALNSGQGWYLFNDESVTPININNTKYRENAYVLFYAARE